MSKLTPEVQEVMDRMVIEIAHAEQTMREKVEEALKSIGMNLDRLDPDSVEYILLDNAIKRVRRAIK